MDPKSELLKALEEKRPVVAVLGAELWVDDSGVDSILAESFTAGAKSIPERLTWRTLIGSGLSEHFFGWLAERYERRPLPTPISAALRFPWSGVFVSSLDPRIAAHLASNGRHPQAVLTGSEIPRPPRSRARPPLYCLYSRAGIEDPLALPPRSSFELATRRMQHAMPMLARIVPTATAAGLIVIEGFTNNVDLLQLEDLLGALSVQGAPAVLWFGGRPKLAGDSLILFDALVESNRIFVFESRFANISAEIGASDLLSSLLETGSGDAASVTFGPGKVLALSPELRLRTEASAFVVDDSWTETAGNLDTPTLYLAFRDFHSGRGTPQALVEGIKRGFSVTRNYESELWDAVTKALDDHSACKGPFVLHGQSATGKTIALLRLALEVRRKGTHAVLYATRSPSSVADIAAFAEAAESCGAKSILLICDTNDHHTRHHDVFFHLRNRGRRVVVIGSSYRYDDPPKSRYFIEAPSLLSPQETSELKKLLIAYLGADNSLSEADRSCLASLYRLLPPGRPKIISGLSTEARSWEALLRARGGNSVRRQDQSPLAAELVRLGLGHELSLLVESTTQDAIAGSDAAAKAIDYVMAAGQLNCDVPINLLLRAVAARCDTRDLASVATLFIGLDLFRWKQGDSEGNDLLIAPRLVLEAELLCSRRLGSARAEADRLIELILAVRLSAVDDELERRFLLDLVQRMGPDGPKGERYLGSYVEIGRALSALRTQFGIANPSLMLQESSFRRAAIRGHDKDAEANRLQLLEECREAVQEALASYGERQKGHGQTFKNLLVEQASIFGYLAFDRAKHGASEDEVWATYQAARKAVSLAAGRLESYFPLDVGLWTPSDLIEHGKLSAVHEAELHSDILSILDKIEPTELPHTQRLTYEKRRQKLGRILGNPQMAEDAFSELDRLGSGAGYFIRAREKLGSIDFSRGRISSSEYERAIAAGAFLRQSWERVRSDPRCLDLLLVCEWCSATGFHPNRGERRPLPVRSTTALSLLSLLRHIIEVEGESARRGTRYLEAALCWAFDSDRRAIDSFRSLDEDSEFESAGRLVRRHFIADESGAARIFSGRVEAPRGKAHWRLHVDGLNKTIDLLERDFPDINIAYGRAVPRFAISFNYIGPIADALGRYRDQ